MRCKVELGIAVRNWGLIPLELWSEKIIPLRTESEKLLSIGSLPPLAEGCPQEVMHVGLPGRLPLASHPRHWKVPGGRKGVTRLEHLKQESCQHKLGEVADAAGIRGCDYRLLCHLSTSPL